MNFEHSSFKEVPKTGVIFVMTEASKRGFQSNRSEWANLGQGAPEVGAIPNCPSRIKNIPVDIDSYEYAPVGGTLELKNAVAQLYNRRFRVGRRSQYTSENVAIGSGGRLALTRIVSTLGPSHVGHFLPDYTAYEELLGSFGTFVPIPISLSPENKYEFTSENLKNEIIGKGLSTILLSNPSNPTGKVIKGQELAEWLDVARELECTLLFDEFYSHYVYNTESPSTSAAEFVEDVNKDPIIIFDGLTKNWRYPGLRISWTIGPKEVIEGLTSAGSFLDGGAPHPIQKLAVELISKEQADKEAISIKEHFKEKANYLHQALNKLGILCEQPESTFYCWGNLENLPKSISSGTALFEKAIDKNLIIVPGIFFDINPGKRRPKSFSMYDSFARFSFGPPIEELKLGLSILEEVIKTA